MAGSPKVPQYILTVSNKTNSRNNSIYSGGQAELIGKSKKWNNLTNKANKQSIPTLEGIAVSNKVENWTEFGRFLNQ